MSITLLDRTARLLDLPPQPLGPQSQRESLGDARGLNIYTDRGRGKFQRNHRGGPRSSQDL
jgi:hypothetical protein